MQRLHRIHFDVLRQQRGACLVSLHVPVQAQRQEALRRLWSQAEEQLSVHESEAVLGPVRYLVDDLPFWETSPLSLSVFCRETQHFVLSSPYAVKPRAVVGERFHLAPLLPVLHEDFHFYVLELMPEGSRLLSGDLYHLRELSEPELPWQLVRSLRRDPYPNPDLETCLATFVTCAPVVVVGPPLLRQALVIPSIRRVDLDGPLHFARIWERLRRHLDDERRQALSLTSVQVSGPEEILAAARCDQIDTLAVAAGAELWGTCERGRWTACAAPARGVVDFVDLTASEVLGHGGRVFVAPAHELPPTGLVAGLKRVSFLRAG